MPAEALENLILDTIESELAKIGTAPLSNWITSTPPGIHVGIPGDDIPGPNLETIWIQHARSEEGSDNVGVASHILHCTFGVWVFSTHAVDGHRRMLNLLQDVRSALLAAERTFFDTFHYGIKLGTFQFTGHDAHIRQGISGGALEVMVDADIEHPAQSAPSSGVNEAQVRDLIRDEFFAHRLNELDLQVQNGAAATNASIRGLRTAGFAERAWKGSKYISLPPTTPNAIHEVIIDYLVNPISIWGEGWSVRAFINRGNTQGPISGEAYVGIQMGSFRRDAPWQTTYASGGLGLSPVVQLRFNYVTEKFEVCFWDMDDTVAPDVTELDTQPTFAVDLNMREFRMDYIPSPTDSRVECYIDNILCHTLSGPRLQSVYGPVGDGTGPGYFMTGGGGPYTTFLETGFYSFKWWYENGLPLVTP